MEKYLLALDQGTTSSRAILFDAMGDVVSIATKVIQQHYPQPGWVEHDPEEIWQTQIETAQEVVQNAGITVDQIAAIGMTNQRETTIIWDTETGKAVYPAIVWQCRRTADICDQLKREGLDELVRRKTGLVLDAYFSATKIQWILTHLPHLRTLAEKGRILFGTVDSWLLWKLTEGKTHATDFTNASRTMLYDIRQLDWDQEILDWLGIPREMLPSVLDSSGFFGCTARHFFGKEIPITGIAGDQQAALFGQGCFVPGMAKNTYGTGCFMLMNTGDKPVQSQNGLLSTIAWGINGEITYALEGSIFIAGAVVQWLRDELGLLPTAAASQQYALQVEDTGGVYVVPAFTGLGAPHWDMHARGTITGITRGTNKYHITRAALEAIAYQTRDVARAMMADAGIGLKKLRVDGGAAENEFLMQFQADILQIPIEQAKVQETTALGAAYLAGLAAGVYPNTDFVEKVWQAKKNYHPQMKVETAEKLYRGWESAVAAAKK